MTSSSGHPEELRGGCIVKLYSGLVLDHLVYSVFCLGRYSDCNAGRMEVEAALTIFPLAKHGLLCTTILSDGDSQTSRALTEADM